MSSYTAIKCIVMNVYGAIESSWLEQIDNDKKYQFFLLIFNIFQYHSRLFSSKANKLEKIHANFCGKYFLFIPLSAKQDKSENPCKQQSSQ